MTIQNLKDDIATAEQFIKQWQGEKKRLLKMMREKFPERKVMIQLIRNGEVELEESVMVNALNRITLYSGFDCLIDCGSEGWVVEEVYRDVERVVFTDQKVKDNRGKGEIQLVQVYGK